MKLLPSRINMRKSATGMPLVSSTLSGNVATINTAQPASWKRQNIESLDQNCVMHRPPLRNSSFQYYDQKKASQTPTRSFAKNSAQIIEFVSPDGGDAFGSRIKSPPSGRCRRTEGIVLREVPLRQLRDKSRRYAMMGRRRIATIRRAPAPAISAKEEGSGTATTWTEFRKPRSSPDWP